MVIAMRKYLNQQVPRYTSYPTAPHFQESVTAEVYADWLASLNPETALSLYFHIPFCAEMCWYCGCHTKVVRRYDPISNYVSALRDEIELVANHIPFKARVVSVHWGGGTPTMLTGNDFLLIMDKVREYYRLDSAAEIAVEIDPRTLDREKAQALARAGVTRASLGVQDFNAEVQAAINRIQPYERTADAIEDLKACGISRINFDLMYGLPHQTVEILLDSVDRAVALGPDRIALFGYAHVPWMRTHQRLIDEAALPDGDARHAQFEAASARLAACGYRRVGLDHFARDDDTMAEALKAGELHRNFQGYTVDPADALLGFGASSIGSLEQGYVQNLAPIKGYMEAVREGRLPIARGAAISDEDRLRRAVIERMMCDSAVDLALLSARYGRPKNHFDSELDQLREMEDDGLIRIHERNIELTEDGRSFVRSVCAVFDTYLGKGSARHSRAV